MTDLKTQLTSHFADFKFEFDYSLTPLTYFKVGGPAEAFVKLTSRDDIIKLVKFCRQQNLKLTILGGASNIIVDDQGVKGLVLQLGHDKIEFLDQLENGQTKVRAEAGLRTALLVSQTVRHGLTGLEFFLGVPGTLGGAIYNNAHYLQDLISEFVDRVEIIDNDGQVKWLTKDECDFSYDYSRFQETHEVILTVDFLLAQGDSEKSQRLIRQATQYRSDTQPLDMPSSGCIFQNVPNSDHLKKLFPQFTDKAYVPGGFLIDQAKLKGTKVGGIQVSDKHAAFFVNTGNGTANDIKELINLVKQTVKEKFGVELQEEVFWLK